MDELEALFAEQEKKLPERERLVAQAHRAHLSGELERAVGLFLQSLTLDNQQAPVHRDLAQVYMGLGQPAMAARHLETALSLTPDYLEARGIHRALSEVYEAQGDQERAQDHYRAFQFGQGYQEREA